MRKTYLVFIPHAMNGKQKRRIGKPLKRRNATKKSFDYLRKYRENLLGKSNYCIED